MKDILVGIDPSLTNCGVAILWPDKTLELHTADLMAALGWLGSKKITGRMIAVIEDPNKNSNVFGQFAKVKTAVLRFAGKEVGQYAMKSRTATLADVQSEFSMAMKVAQNVGMSKAAAQLIISMMEKAGVPVLTIPPSDRHRADRESLKANFRGVQMLSMPTKTTAEQFRQLTGYAGRSNEHNRDAATLIHGRTIVWAETQLKIQKSKTT
jgi:hypothetical protein